MMLPERKSLRQIGKEDIKKYYNAKIRKLTDALILLLSLLGSALLFLPLIFLMIQLFQLYSYLAGAILVLIFVCMLLLMVFNGVSNVFQIKLAKRIVKDEAIDTINEKAVFVYEITNIGFAIFLIFVLFLTVCTL